MLYFDTHTHIYPCFHLPSFFQSALNNLNAISEGDSQAEYAILLLESANSNWYDQLLSDSLQSKLQAAGYQCQICDDELVVTDNSSKLHILNGIQYISAERIEVLGIGSTRRYAGKSVEKLIAALHSDGAFPVLPWGFGKWSGARGKIITKLLTSSGLHFALGDNRGRMNLFKTPRQFKLAVSQNIPVLPGSDPLPVAGQEARVGLAGIGIKNYESGRPLLPQLLRLLNSRELDFVPFAKHNGIFEFVTNQIRMRI